MLVDIYFIYRFVKKLTTPFEKWEAFSTGVIDKNGEIITKPENRTPEQKASLSLFDRLSLKIRKIISKIPGVNTKLASYAAALYLIRENKEFSAGIINESVEDMKFDEDKMIKFINEQLTAMSEEMVTTSNIAPLIDGTAVSKKAQKKYVKQNSTDSDDSNEQIVRRVVRAVK